MTATAYISAKDLATRYSVSPRQILRLADIGKIPGVRIGKVWRFDGEEVHRVLTTHTTNPFPRAKV